MSSVFLALQRSFTTLGQGRIWLYLFGPALLALVVMVGLSMLLLDQLVATFVEQPPMNWIAAWGAFWLAHLLAALGGWVIILAASYLLAMLLTAIVVMPLLLRYLAQTEYSGLARNGSDSLVAGACNSLWAAVLFVLGWLLTLPLWLVPGLGLLLPLFWMAWLNRRTFAYDALSVHATDEEWRALRRQQAMPLLGLGVLMAALAHVPLVGMLAPSLAALAYIHFCLEALRQYRQRVSATGAREQEELQ